MHEPPLSISQNAARRSVLLPDAHVLTADDGELAAFLLGGQNFSYSVAADGALTWGAFGQTFTTLGELRAIAREHPVSPAEAAALLEPAEWDLPPVSHPDTVGIEIFRNMLDTIAFLRVRLRALADVVMEKGVTTGPELLGRYHEYHERSFQAFRDLMLLRPEVFDERFAGWLATEKAYRARIAGEEPSDEPQKS
ncbi:MAG: hypothetical protein M3R44_06440 [Candidatus Eremiobacteraeota bacterium]|nr:hypothetical protein [Candidatus Eremiobacteraeota bacterium]